MANLFLGVFYNLSVWYKLTDRTSIGAWIACAGAIVTVVLNLLLVPRYGYTGAAWAHLACYLCMVLLAFSLGRKYYRIDYDIPAILLYFILALGIFFVSTYFLFAEGVLKLLLHGFYMTAFLLVVALLERKKFRREFV